MSTSIRTGHRYSQRSRSSGQTSATARKREASEIAYFRRHGRTRLSKRRRILVLGGHWHERTRNECRRTPSGAEVRRRRISVRTGELQFTTLGGNGFMRRIESHVPEMEQTRQTGFRFGRTRRVREPTRPTATRSSGSTSTSTPGLGRRPRRRSQRRRRKRQTDRRPRSSRGRTATAGQLIR